MEKILSNLASVEWWFTGLFFVFIASILPFAIRKLREIPVFFNQYKRKKQLEELKKIKRIRRYNFLSYSEIIKTYSYFCIFAIVSVLFFYSYILDPLVIGKIENTSLDEFFKFDFNTFTKPRHIVLFVLSFPLYFFEIKFLRQRNFTNRLLSYRLRLLNKNP